MSKAVVAPRSHTANKKKEDIYLHCLEETPTWSPEIQNKFQTKQAVENSVLLLVDKGIKN